MVCDGAKNCLKFKAAVAIVWGQWIDLNKIKILFDKLKISSQSWLLWWSWNELVSVTNEFSQFLKQIIS